MIPECIDFRSRRIEVLSMAMIMASRNEPDAEQGPLDFESRQVVEKKWRRGQESNLHSLAAGGFQVVTRGVNLILPLRTNQ